MASDHGPWEPLSLDEACALMDSVCSSTGTPWWFTGGHALELHLGRSWRNHDDLDVSIRRSHAPVLSELGDDWEVHLAADGVLSRWDGSALDGAAHHNNLWLRRGGGAWALDVTIGDGDDERWTYRRDPTFRLPWAEAVLADDRGRRYLAPALQLLFKSTHLRPKDDLDARVVIPELDAESLAVLGERLPAGHPWLELVGSASR